MYGYIIPEGNKQRIKFNKKFNNKTKINFSVETTTDGKIFEQGASIPPFTSGSDNITQY